MSTYNGEKYIEQQLDSIINQSIGFEKIQLIIRDDGSSDGTRELLKKYQKNFSNIKVKYGENLGAAKSFWELIKECPIESDYYAFADQDDIWLVNKISSAIEAIEIFKDPTLYYSNALYVDKYGESLERYAIRKENHLSVPTLMAGMPAMGCTMLFNKSALGVFKKAKLTAIEMHDRTCFLISYLIGRVIYDDEAYIQYRQHENNVIGHSGRKNIEHRIKRFRQSYALWFKNKEHSAVVQAMDMLNNYSSLLRDDDREYLKLISTYRKNPLNKMKLIFDENIKYISKGTRRSYKLRIFLNLF